MESASISTRSSTTFFTSSYFLKIKGIKLPAPTDGSIIRTVSLLKLGKELTISLTRNLFV